MDHLARLIAFALLLVLGDAASAAYVRVATQTYADGSGSITGATAGAYCQARAVFGWGSGATGTAENIREHTTGQMITDCRVTGGSLGSNQTVIDSAGTGRCSAGGWIPGGGGGCYDTVSACPSGQSANGLGVCTSQCPAPGTQQGSSGDAWGSTAAAGGGGLAICVNGCLANSSGNGSSDGGQTWTHWGPLTHTGQTCSGSPGGPEANPRPSPPPPGYCPGEVNGQPVTVPCTQGTSRGPSTNTSGSSSDGGTSTGTTTQQTSCSNGRCTTTTTTTTTTTGGAGGAGGTSTTSTSTEQGESEYCAANPGDRVNCAEEDGDSSFGGSCAGSFTCDGDAIQCAIAREQHVRSCQLFDTDTALSAIGRNAANGQQPADHPANNGEVSSYALSSMLDASPLFGGSGGCPSDVSVEYQGHSLTLPFSRACSVLQMLGNIWVGLAYLAAFAIVFRRG
jgi:hypothetical protein